MEYFILLSSSINIKKSDCRVVRSKKKIPIKDRTTNNNLNNTSCAVTDEYSLSQCPGFGNPVIIAVHVQAEDTSTSTSVDDLSDNLFGTFGKNFTMVSQFTACSYNQFNFQPFSGTTSTGVHISNGIAEISLNRDVIGEAAGVIASDILSKVNSIYGDIESQFDFVIICLPYGTFIGSSTDWKGYAFIHSYLSIINDENCNYPSVIMHEIGHNIGLSHSNDEFSYGDTSGFMGISYNNTSGPIKCFNGPKSWQLEWYADRHYPVSITIIDSNEFWTEMVGVAYFNMTGRIYYNVMKLYDSDDGYDYYITYNDQTGINSGAGEGDKYILITKRPSGSAYEDSTLVSRLEYLQTYELIRVKKFKSILINFGSFSNSTTEPTVVRVGLRSIVSFCTTDIDCNDGNSCSTDTCNFDTTLNDTKCIYTRSCDCGVAITVNLTTNDFPSDYTWGIKNYDSDEIILSSFLYEDPFNLESFDSCLEVGRYIFSIFYTENTTQYNGTFALLADDFLLDYGIISQESYIETFFIICTTDEHCRDYDACTIDQCDLSTRTCNNTRVSDDLCTDCASVTVNITTDNYPDETSWSIHNYNTSDFVLNGDPYTFDLPSFSAGRRSKPTRSTRRQAPGRVNMQRTLLLEDDTTPETITKSMCLEKQYRYFFTIQDSFGDGICCEEGEGSFIVNANGITLIEGGNFSDTVELEFMFLDCTQDSDCDDNDICTLDTCSQETSLCLYSQKSCSECGSLVTIGITTDFYPIDIRWVITKNNTEILKSEDYGTTYTYYETTQCLSYGSYLFTINDSRGNGISCEELNCGYSIYIDDQIVKETFGDFETVDEFVFDIIHPSNNPSEIPTLLPSKLLTTSPKAKETIVPTILTASSSLAPTTLKTVSPTKQSKKKKANTKKKNLKDKNKKSKKNKNKKKKLNKKKKKKIPILH